MSTDRTRLGRPDPPGNRPPRLQPLTRARVTALGDAGAAWAASLPATLADLAGRWGLRYAAELPGGSASYVCRADRDGRPVVVKVALEAADLAAEAEHLREADGQGYVHLLEYAPDRQAVLLELLGPALGSGSAAPERQLEVLADTLAVAWRDPGGRRPAAGTDKASQLGRFIASAWAELGHPDSARAVRLALTYVEDLVPVPDGDWVVVHGDPHPANLLRVRHPRPGAETGYCFVDPDGFVADRAYDLGVAVRDWCGRVLAAERPHHVLREYCDRLAAHAGADPERIWRWGFVERVSTGLYLLNFGATKAAAPYLRSAARLV